MSLSPDTTLQVSSEAKQSDSFSSRFSGECDDLLKSSNNYDALFDSGYNSNMQSKSFLDLEGDLETPLQSFAHVEPVQNRAEKSGTCISKSALVVPQWTDSGVCITDSGLSISEEEANEKAANAQNQPTLPAQTSQPCLDYSQLPKVWLKQNSEGDTLLHLSIIEDLEEIACSIIQNISNADELNSYNYLYQTPLHLAVLMRQTSTIQHLLSRGVSLNFQDNCGNTPLHIACKYSLTEIVRYLLLPSHPSPLSVKCLNIRNYNGETCVHLAAYSGNLITLELLLRAGADVNIQEGKSGKTILHWAVENMHVQLVLFLLNKCKASLEVRTFADQTVVHFARQNMLKYKSDTFGEQHTKANKIAKLLSEVCDDPRLLIDIDIDDSDQSEFDYSSEDDE